MVTTVPFSATGVAAGPTLQVPQGRNGGYLVAVRVTLSSSASGPVFAFVNLQYDALAYATLVEGTVRGDSNASGSDTISWTGRVPLDPTRQASLVCFKTDTTTSIIVTAISELA